MTEMQKRTTAAVVIPIFITFFTMGFVDFVGTAANQLKDDLGLSAGQVSLFTTMVFFWFFIFAIPSSYCMNRYGRRATVLLSVAVTIAACIFPIIAYAIPGVSSAVKLILMVISFILLGIGNAIMQVSLNPLIANLVSPDRYSSTLTSGQFVKAIASFSAPLIASWLGSALHMWWLTYVLFLVISVVAYLSLLADKVEEKKTDAPNMSFGKVLGLLKDKIILLCFIGIMCHVGMDAGVNTYAPRFLIGAHAGMGANQAAYTTSLYFLFRTIGLAAGMYALTKLSNRISIIICSSIVGLSVVAFIAYTVIPGAGDWILWAALALIGFGNSNMFAIMYSIAGLHMPERQNEISGLMIMGLIGGAILPPIMGGVSDAIGGQLGSALVLIVPACYFVFLACRPKLLSAQGKAAA